MANDFSGNSDVLAVYNFESGALTDDSQGSNDLTANNSPASDTTNYKQGAGSVLYVDADVDSHSILDANLPSDWPFKGSTTNVKHFVGFWFRPTSTFFSVSGYTTGKGANNLYSWLIYQKSNQTRVAIGYNGGASIEWWDTSYTALTAGQWYWIGSGLDFESGNKDGVLYLWDDTAGSFIVDGSTHTYTNDINIETARFEIAGIQQGTAKFDGNIDEYVVAKDWFSADDIDAIIAGTYSAGATQSTINLSGGVSGIANTNADISKENSIAGVAIADGLTTSAISVLKNVNGAIIGDADAAGHMVVSKRVSGTVVSEAFPGGLISISKKISGASSGIADVQGELLLQGTIRLSGGVDSVAGTSGQLFVNKGVSGSIFATSGIAGQTATTKRLSGVAEAIAGAAGQITITQVGEKLYLTGAVSAEPGLAGVMSVEKGIYGTIEAITSAGGELFAKLSISGDADAITSAVGELSRIGEGLGVIIDPSIESLTTQYTIDSI